MKSGNSITRKNRQGDSTRAFQNPRRPRRRSSEIQLESLEQRMLLSVTPKIPEPAAVYPKGLGLAYTALSEQAHGVGLNLSSPGQYTGNTATTSMADLTAYLQQLGKSLLPAPTSPAASTSGTTSPPIQPGEDP